MAFHNPLSETVAIGYFAKPHGVTGEINLVMDQDIEPAAVSCIILDIDGINVPFFFSSIRSRGYRSFLVTIDGIANEYQASTLTNKTVYALKDDVRKLYDEEPDDGFYVADLIGFTVNTCGGDPVGEIVDYDDSTDNVLMIVKNSEGTEILIPVADEYIEEIDVDNKVLTMNLPDGLPGL